MINYVALCHVMTVYIYLVISIKWTEGYCASLKDDLQTKGIKAHNSL